MVLNGGSCSLSNGSCSVTLKAHTDYNLNSGPSGASYQFDCGDGTWHSSASNTYSCAYSSTGSHTAQVKTTNAGDSAIATATVTISPATCPTDQSVTATPNTVAVGGTTTLSAPSGWSGGAFVLSNNDIIALSNYRVENGLTKETGTGLKPGQVSVTGTGWKASNGATNCSLNEAIVNVAQPTVTLSVARHSTNQWVTGTTDHPGVLWINKGDKIDLKYAFQDFPQTVTSCVRELGVSSWQGKDTSPSSPSQIFSPTEPISSSVVPFRVTCTDSTNPPVSAEAVVNVHIYPTWREINPGGQ
jgi:hypothetical protein